MNKQGPNRLDHDHTFTRRKFLGTTALGSAALLSGGLTSLIQRSASAAGGFDFIEKSIPELQDAIDRKSTRLNSSHVSISYAVFCLKTKIVRRGCRSRRLPPATGGERSDVATGRRHPERCRCRMAWRRHAPRQLPTSRLLSAAPPRR